MIDPQFAFDRLAERFADGLHRDAVVDAVKEAFDDHVHGLVPREPAAHAIENLFGIDAASGRPVRATDVVGLDLEPGNRIGPAIGAEEQAVVSLVSIGHLGRRVDANHSPPDDPRLVAQHVFVEKVAAGIGGLVCLLRVVRQELPIGGERDAIDFSGGPRPGQGDFLVNVGQSCADPADGPLQGGAASDNPRLMSQMPDVLVPVLKLHIPQRSPRLPTNSSTAPTCMPGLSSVAEPVSSSSVADAPSSRITSVWLKSAAPEAERPMRLYSGSVMATFRGT